MLNALTSGREMAMVWAASLTALAADKLMQFACEYATKSHSYRVSIIEDGEAFTIDPHLECERCGKPISAETYDHMVGIYATVMAASQS